MDEAVNSRIRQGRPSGIWDGSTPTRRQRTRMFYARDNPHLERLTIDALFHVDHASVAAHSTEQSAVAG